MSRKNFKVATAENGKTTAQDKKHSFIVTDKTPTGKVKTLKDKEKIRKEREEQYKNFRIKSLTRRAKRMGLTEEQIKVKVEELKNQLDTPNSYDVLVFFNVNDRNLVVQALKNEGLVYKIMGPSYVFLVADQETLATIREIMPPSAKVHPYVKKKPPILPVPESKKKAVKPRTKAEKKALALAAKKKRKADKIAAHFDRKKHAEERKKAHNKAMRKQAKAKKFFDKRCLKASKKASGTVVQLEPKKASNASKKASTTNLKKAA